MHAARPDKRYDVAIAHMADARFYPLFQRQAFSLRDAGYRVAFVSWENRKGEGLPGWPGIDVFPITIPTASFSGKLFFARYMAQLTLRLLRLPCRLYQAVDPVALPAARLAAGRHGSRYNYFSLEYFQGVSQVKGRPLVAAAWRSVERFGIRRAANVAAVCDTMGELIASAYGVARPTTIMNVPPLADYAGPAKPELRSACGLGSDATLVVFKGELGPGRGIMPFLEALAGVPQVHFALIGNGTLDRQVRDHAAKLGISDRVHLLGQVAPQRFPALLADADAGHCIHENIGLNMRITLPSKLFDYLHAGLPVLCGNGPEVSRIVGEQRLGWVCDPDSVESIRQGLRQLLQERPTLAAMRQRCREAAQRYCWEKEEKVYLRWVGEALAGVR